MGKKQKKERPKVFINRKLTPYGYGYLFGYFTWILAMTFSGILTYLILLFFRNIYLILSLGIFCYGIILNKTLLSIIRKNKEVDEFVEGL